MDPSKKEVVKNWKVPKPPSEIRSFLGLAGNYRHFIANFSKVAKPLTSLTQKNQKYEQGKEQEKAFQTLKDNLCNTPVLSLPDGIRDFVVFYDASNQGLVDRLAKSAHFLATREDYSMKKLARLYIDEIVARHGVLVSIILDRDGRFTSCFWKTLLKALGTQLDMSTAYHPQMDRQSKRTIQTLEDMLRASPVMWAKIRESRLIGPKLVQETSDKVVLIKEKLKATRDRQKSYVDNRRKPLEFEVGDRVLLKVSPWKGVIRFGKKVKSQDEISLRRGYYDDRDLSRDYSE
uniref:Reverse transcriptase domain-containing protein n=1 Tax=Tanacetum cinerariifolium TaxID=118510 RepID=A0A6L2J323_TANCI|nr:reverse transcriptase domain-containing protein [Tanacetum cinerariifolium]